MTYGAYEALDIDVRDGIATLTLDNPSKMNALTPPQMAEIVRVWRDFDDDPDVRVVVVTGTGTRAFCAGGDVGDVDPTTMPVDERYEFVIAQMQDAYDLAYGMVNSRKPIISAINGAAVGAGLVVALLADIPIMAEEAKLVDGHTPIGVAAGDHAAMIWPLLCGMAKAKYYLFTSDPIDGREAERLGLVSQVVPRAELMDTAISLATRLASGPQQALHMTKRALNQWLRLGGVVSFDLSLVGEMLNFLSPDHVEGINAFKEKRPPSFPTTRRR